MKSRFYIGPMSKNIVDAVIDFSNFTNIPVGLIPSRRQIDFDSGYVNNWTTPTFSEYVTSKSKNVVIQRDHGGPKQGSHVDDGLASLKIDCQHVHAIHLDPWMICKTFQDGCTMTKDLIDFCYSSNSKIKYEIGTEQTIFPYSASDLNTLITYLKNSLSPDKYANIEFAVIQTGTSLIENTNTGTFNKSKLDEMVSICKLHSLKSKEHNGDYLPHHLIHEKFDGGLDSINIAPEFGQIETQTYLEILRGSKLVDTYFDICYNSGRWVKWVNKDFDPFLNKEKLINICGHYVLSDPRFLQEIKSVITEDIDAIVREKVMSTLHMLHKL